MLIVSGKIDLNNPPSLAAFHGKHLSEDAVTRIRMLQVQFFGMPYFKQDLRKTLEIEK